MTRFFYDSEFLEDGKTIDLISIGIVSETGREYYAINDEAPWQRITRHDWLMNNVVPYLPMTDNQQKAFSRELPLDLTHPCVKSPYVIAQEVRQFLLGNWQPGLMADDPPEVELWAWYGAYDHVKLMQLWGRMIDRPQGIPMWTNDLRQEVHRLGNPRLPLQAAGEHDALEDARWLKRRWEWLQERSSICGSVTQSCTSGA